MEKVEFWIKVGAFIISLILLVKGIYEYSKAQKWKKAEFISKEIKDFLSDLDIKRALIMLDWNSNELDLKTNEIPGKSKLYFDDNLIISALQTHLQSPVFSDEEAVIKGIFDIFLDRLTMFDIYIETGLIRTKDIKPYLIYWIQIIADKQNNRKSTDVKDQIWKYIDEYGYERIRLFCNRFGFKN